MTNKEIDENAKKEIWQKYMELQMLDRQIKNSQAQLQALEAQVIELENVSRSLDELNKVKIGSEIFVPVASGIFTKAKLLENSELLVTVGGSTAVKKSVSGVKELLTKQTIEIRKIQQEISKQLQSLAQEAEKSERVITALLTKK